MSVLWDTITEVASMQENCVAVRKKWAPRGLFVGIWFYQNKSCSSFSMSQELFNYV